MKESFAKIQAWIKAHPKLSIAIGVVIVVIGYFVLKSTGGNPTGEPGTEPIDGGALGANENTDPLAGLSGLGSAAGNMSPVTSGGESAPSLVSSLPSITGSGDSAAFDMGTVSGFDPYAAPVAAFTNSAPVSNESLITNQKTNTMAKPANLPVATLAKTAASVPARTLSTVTKAGPAKSTAQPVKPSTVIKSVTSPVKGLSTNTSAGGVKYTGPRLGYYWDAKKGYVKITGAAGARR